MTTMIKTNTSYLESLPQEQAQKKVEIAKPAIAKEKIKEVAKSLQLEEKEKGKQLVQEKKQEEKKEIKQVKKRTLELDNLEKAERTETRTRRSCGQF